MDDFALVLNAGSSSLKFCVYRRPEGGDWSLEARGQVEGIGTSPHLSAKGDDGQKLVDEHYEAAEVNNGDDAIKNLAAWLRSNYGGSRVLGVGHRVVHGGPNFDGPVIIDQKVLSELHELVPLAPLPRASSLSHLPHEQQLDGGSLGNHRPGDRH